MQLANLSTNKTPNNCQLESYQHNDSFDACDIFQSIWPEFYKTVYHYAQMLLEGNISSIGFSVHGPSACGKTTFVKQLVSKLNGQEHYLRGLDLIYSYGVFGEGTLKRCVADATGETPCIVVVDDADLLVVGEKAVEKQSMCQFVEELDTCRQVCRLLVVLITQDETRFHHILRRDQYFPFYFHTPTLSEDNRKIFVTSCLRKLGDPVITDVLLIQHEKLIESTCRECSSCTVGDLAKMIALFVQKLRLDDLKTNINQITSYWETCATSVKYSVTNTEVENVFCDWIRFKKQQPYCSAYLEEQFEELVTVIHYSLGVDETFFPKTVGGYRGAILYGPSGVGKTRLCYRVIQKFDLHTFFLDGASLLSSAIGQSEKRLKQIFQLARRFTPSIIFLDQIDLIFQRRDDSGHTSAESFGRLTSLFLSELDGFSTDEYPKCFVLVTAQHIQFLDPALLRPGRLEWKLFIDVPTPEERYDVIRSTLETLEAAEMHMDEEIKQEGFLNRVVQCTSKWNIADISMLVQNAVLDAIRESFESYSRASSSVTLQTRHFEHVLDNEENGTLR